MEISETLIYTASVFVITKVVFSILGWYSTLDGDKLYRRHLDKIWTNIQSMTIFELTHKSIVRAKERVRLYFKNWRKAIWFFTKLFFIMNIIMFFLGIVFVIHLNPDTSWELAFYLTLLDPLRIIGIVIFALVSTSIDVVSIFIAWLLLSKLSEQSTVFALVFHFFIDLVVSIVMSVVSLFLSTFVLAIFLGGLDPDFTAFEGGKQAIGAFQSFTVEGFIVTFDKFGIELIKALGGFFFFFSASSCFPILIYFFLLILLIILRIIPMRLKGIIEKTIFLITTDDKPVLKQLGNIIGGIAALLAALAKTL